MSGANPDSHPQPDCDAYASTTTKPNSDPKPDRIASNDTCSVGADQATGHG